MSAELLMLLFGCMGGQSDILLTVVYLQLLIDGFKKFSYLTIAQWNFLLGQGTVRRTPSEIKSKSFELGSCQGPH